jgi:hypothetical protein
MQEHDPALEKRWQRCSHFLATDEVSARITGPLGFTGLASIDRKSAFPGAKIRFAGNVSQGAAALIGLGRPDLPINQRYSRRARKAWAGMIIRFESKC